MLHIHTYCILQTLVVENCDRVLPKNILAEKHWCFAQQINWNKYRWQIKLWGIGHELPKLL